MDGMDSSLTGGFNVTALEGNATAQYDFLQAMLDFSDFDAYNQYMARVFWYVVIGVIGFFTMVHILRGVVAYIFGTGFFMHPLALARAATYPQIGQWKSVCFCSTGELIMILLYFGLILILVYVNVAVAGFQRWIVVAFRAGWITVAQLPLLVLLAGKRNLIGYLTGTSYERLNVLHRWVARTIFFTATLHMIYLYRNFSFYGLVSMEWSTDSCPSTGTAAWVILFWIVISSVAPIRNLRHEIFIAQHIISYVGFTVAVSIHIQPYTRATWIYAWIPAGFFVLDRGIRFISYIWNNISSRGFMGRATLLSLPGEVTQVTVEDSRLRAWRPGQHVLLSIPELGKLQAHPFTVASVSSNRAQLKFLIRAKEGFTRRLFNKASEAPQRKFTAIIEGPYGNPQPFESFERIFLISGGTGATYTIPLLLDLSRRSSVKSIRCKQLTFIWVVRYISQIFWFAEEIREAVDCAGNLKMNIQVFVTGDDGSHLEALSTRASLKEKGAPRMESVEESRPASDGNIVARLDLPECVNVIAGRPAWSSALFDLYWTNDESGVAVSGPAALTEQVRNQIAKINLDLAIRKAATSGVYLHAERYGF